MSKFIVLESDSDFRLSGFERFLFNHARHRHTQTTVLWKTFCLTNTDTDNIVARIYFAISAAMASSPCSAPFGSVEFSEDLPPEQLPFFFNEIEMRLRSEGVMQIILKDTPHQYRPMQATLLTASLLNSGFRIISQEINSGIVVDGKAWVDKISRAEQKRLKKCKQAGLSFRQLPLEKLEVIYNFIHSCREERSASLSMSLSRLKATVIACPDDFLLFGVFQGDDLVAASVAIKINERILYDFYHAHARSTDQLSPVVSLIDGIYHYCCENKFSLLDLGTSASEGNINFGLLNFKTQIGGEPSLKFTFEKNLA